MSSFPFSVKHFFVSGVFTKNIYVTQNFLSRDHKDCGSNISPCKTIEYAIKISTARDTILIDGGKEKRYEYVLNEPVLIEKELTLASIKFQQNPRITIKPDLTRETPYTFFSISKNFTLSAVDVYAQGISLLFNLLTINAHNISVTLSDSNLKYILVLFDLTSVTEVTVHIESCIIEGDGSIEDSTSFYSAMKTTENNVITNKAALIEVNNCHFIRTPVDLCEGNICDVQFARTSFIHSIVFVTSNNRAKFFDNSIFIQSALVQSNEYNLECQLILQNVNFKGSPTFRSFGRIYFLVNIEQCHAKIHNCNFESSYTRVLNVYRSNANIKNSTFTNNYQLGLFKEPGLLRFYDSSTIISDCRFRNNSVPTPQGVVLKFESTSKVSSYVLINHTTIDSAIHPNGFENLLVSIQTPNLYFEAAVNLSCPVNHNLLYTLNRKERIGTLTYFFALCRKCGSNSYSIESASISWDSFKWAFNDQTIVCTPCPYEAICEKGIKSKGNYWGYKTKKDLVDFIYCPTLYCCTSPSSCLSYNTCYQNRHNRLCGECTDGYSTGLFGHSRCIENSFCNNSYFWIVYIFLIGFYMLFFMYLQEILLFIKRVIQKIICYHGILSIDIKEYEEIVDKDELVFSEDSDIPYQLPPDDSTNSIEYPEKSVKISGLIKIIFFFYQTAFILRINSSTKAQFYFPGIADVLLSFFNIRIDISSTYLKICPFKNNGIISVEVIRSGIIILCPAVLLLTILFCPVCKNVVSRIHRSQKIRKSKADLRQYSVIDYNVPNYAKLPSIVRMKVAYIQLLLVGFASLAVLVFKMINCVEILGQKYLYMQATVPCYTIWQKILMIIIIIWVVPFWLSIYISCSLLQKCKITPNEYLFIATIPLTVFLYLIRAKFYNPHTSLVAKDAMLAREFLRVVNEPFRNISDKPIKIQWESVLIFRRLLLIIVSTFLVSPLNKLYPVGFLLILYLTHHLIVQPYKESILNLAEGISLAALCFLTLLNNFWAFTDEIDMTRNSMLIMTGKVFIYVELAVLMIPIFAIFGLVFAILFRKCAYKIKRL